MKWLSCLLMFASLNVHAQKFYPTSFDVPAVMSFEQLMYLPEAKRIEYIKDVRRALSEVEQSMMKGMKSRKAAELELWKEEMQALLLRLGDMAVPSAFAGNNEVPAAPLTRGLVIAQPAAAPPCPSGMTYIPSFGRCAKTVSTGTTQCGDNADVRIENAATFCVSRVIPSVVRRTDNPAPQAFPLPAAGTEVSPLLNLPQPQVANPALRQDPPARLDLARSAPPTVGPTREAAVDLARSQGYTFVPVPSTCKKREEAANYHADAKTAYEGRQGRDLTPPMPYRNCLMGGMFSEYNNGEIKAGNCKKVQEFPPGTDAGAEKLKCTGRKAMCNPMLYCGPKKGEAHCLNVTQDLTKQCEKKASDKCDPFSGDTLVPGAKEQWQEFAQDMKKICGGDRAGKRFNEYFCEECKLLTERMRQIEKKYAAYTANMPAPAAQTGDLSSGGTPPPTTR